MSGKLVCWHVIIAQRFIFFIQLGDAQERIYKIGCEQKAAFSYSKILTFIHLETYVTIRVLIYMFCASEITF